MVVNVAVRNVKYIGTLNYILYKSRLSCCLCERCHTKEVDISVITVNTPSAMDPVSYLPACLCGFLSFNRSSTIDLWACQAWPEIPQLERTVFCLTFGDWDDQMTELFNIQSHVQRTLWSSLLMLCIWKCKSLLKFEMSYFWSHWSLCHRLQR